MSGWYYLIEQEQKGPVAEDDIKSSLSANELPPDTFVWQEGMENWLPASDVPAFASAMASVPVTLFPPEKETGPEPFAPSSPGAPSQAYPLELVQTDLLRRKQTIELLSGEAIRVKSGRGRKAVDAIISLKNLKPEPHHLRKLHYPALVMIVPLGLFTVFLLIAGIMALFGDANLDVVGCFVGAFIFAVPTALFVGMMYAKSQNSLVFEAYSGAPLVLWFQNPDARTFGDFTSRLQAAIAQASVAPVVLEPIIETPKGCVECHSPEVVPGFATPLCQPCRDRLIRTPIPLWLKVTAAVLFILFLYSASRVPSGMSAAIACEKGNMAEAKGDHAGAMAEYRRTLAIYPDAPDAIRGMARSAHLAGDQKTAVEYANKLIGPTGEVNKDDLPLINEIRGTQP